jgi:hypothetical protein
MDRPAAVSILSPAGSTAAAAGTGIRASAAAPAIRAVSIVGATTLPEDFF